MIDGDARGRLWSQDTEHKTHTHKGSPPPDSTDSQMPIVFASRVRRRVQSEHAVTEKKNSSNEKGPAGETLFFLAIINNDFSFLCAWYSSR